MVSPRVHRLILLIVIALLCEAGPGSSHPLASATPIPGDDKSPSLAPEGWDAAIRLPEAVDRNPAPDVVEIDLTARIAPVTIDGKRVDAWTYNGGLPGPLIRTRIGDRLIVHFTNDLPQPTTVHWHGVRVPIEMDGVPGISQPDVQRGESFTYDFVVRDAGLYWYHPHVMSAAQVGYGLYGALLVEDPGDGVGVADELTLVLSDIGFDAKGVLEPADSGGSAGMATWSSSTVSVGPYYGRAPARRNDGESSTPLRAAFFSSSSRATRSPPLATTADCRSIRSPVTSCS
jgi:FtsP/CotA-like multicopper oxidase with cupredoxin domain